MRTKKVLMAITAVCFTLSSVKAQTVNGQRLSELKAPIIELTEVVRTFDANILISLNYGQDIQTPTKDSYIKDDDNKNLVFNSVVDAVNKFKSYGYELFQIYVDTNNRKFYVLKKK